MNEHERDLFDLGLQADLAMLTRSPIDRRKLLKMGAIGIGMLLTGCATSTPATSSAPTAAASNAPTIAAAPSAPTAASAATTSTGSSTSCVTEIPQETAGPYPADGSRASNQSLNALALSGIVRSDIRASLGTGNVAQGIPSTIVLNLVNSQDNCTPLANYAVYIWHCDREGNYSLYSSSVTNEDYLRGVQAAGSDGKVTFTSIFPACYAGRWPHVHFEIYPSLEKATSSANAVHTSQLALPEDVCNTAYTTNGYAQSVKNLAQLSLATDNVFSDGVSQQMATVTGDTTKGYTIQLTVGVNV